MTLLSERVKKAKQLIFSAIPGTGETLAGTWGSNDDYYEVTLFQCKRVEIQIADKNLSVNVISTRCEQLNNGNGKLNPMETCKGNCRHTICYHGIGWLVEVLRGRKQFISFYDDIFSALNGLNFGGKLAKVVSKQGNGFVWAIIQQSSLEILDVETNRILMRGNEDDEGID